jgi:hypothetical protein
VDGADGGPQEMMPELPQDGSVDGSSDGGGDVGTDSAIVQPTVDSVWPGTTTTSGAFFLIGNHLDGVSRVEVAGMIAELPAGGLSRNHAVVLLPVGTPTGSTQLKVISSLGPTLSVPVQVVGSVSGVPAAPPMTMIPNPVGFNPDGVNNDWINEYDGTDSRYFLKKATVATDSFTFTGDPNTQYTIAGTYTYMTGIIQFSMYLNDPSGKEEYAGLISSTGQSGCPRMILFPRAIGTQLLLRPYSCGADEMLGDSCAPDTAPCRPDLQCVKQVCVGDKSLIVSLTFSVDSWLQIHLILPDGGDLNYDAQIEGGTVDSDPCEFSCAATAPNVENAMFLQAAPTGQYGVYVENVDGRAAGDFSIVVTSNGQDVAAFSGTLPAQANAVSGASSFTLSP